MKSAEFIERGELDAARDARRDVKCRDCRFLAYDMDGNYCGSPESFESASPFGQGLTLARSDNGVCGKDGRLWQAK